MPIKINKSFKSQGLNSIRFASLSEEWTSMLSLGASLVLSYENMLFFPETKDSRLTRKPQLIRLDSFISEV